MIEIVIPTYNRKNYLEECISSILNQKNKKDFFSILVVDNASTDDTEEYMKNIVSDKIRYIKNDRNIGIEKNIIKCLKNSLEEYVMLMSDDDCLSEDAGEYLNKILKSYSELSVIISSVNVFVEKKNITTRKFYEINNIDEFLYTKSVSTACEKMLLRGTLMSGIVYKKNTLDLKGLNNHYGSLYPQLYLLGISMGLGSTYFSNKPYLFVRDANKKNWEYRNDFMNLAILNIIKDVCASNNIKKKIQDKIIKDRISVCHNFLITSKRISLKKFINVFFTHLSIKEYRNSARFWFFFIIILMFGENITFYIGLKLKNLFSIK